MDETQKFRESHLALKSKIFHSSPLTKCSFTFMQLETMHWCALEKRDLKQAFQYIQRYYISCWKLSRATWSQKTSEKLMKLRNFETHTWLWRAKYSSFLSSSENFMMSLIFDSFCFRCSNQIKIIMLWFLLNKFWKQWSSLHSKLQKEWLRAPSPQNQQAEGLTIHIYMKECDIYLFYASKLHF